MSSAASPSEGGAVKAPPGDAAPLDDVQADSAFGVLPDAVVSCVFKALGVQASWPLRSVCRRWRRVVEETRWSRIELRMELKAGAAAAGLAVYNDAYGPPLYNGPLGAAATQPAESGAAAAERNRRTVAAACELLAAYTRGCSRRGGAAQQPREVSVELYEGSGICADPDPGRDGDLVRSFLVGALRALQRPEGEPSALEGLSIGIAGHLSSAAWSQRSDPSHDWLALGEWGGPRPPPPRLPWPGPGELRAALAPFGALRSLDLYFNGLSAGAGAEEAAAIAAACPLLSSLSLPLAEEAGFEALAALAPLAHLERLLVAGERSSGVSRGLAALAGGRAGRSLKSLSFYWGIGLYAGDFPRRSGWARRWEVEVGGGGLRALARMRGLEAVETLRVGPPRLEPAEDEEEEEEEEEEAGEALGGLGLGPGEVGALGELAGLREAALRVDAGREPAAAGEFLRSLAGALARPSNLARLWLRLGALNRWGTHGSELQAAPEEVADFLRSEGPRRALTDLGLVLARPLSEAEAEAIAALPALERLEVAAAVDPDDSESAALRPYRVLRSLRPEVKARASLKRRWDGRLAGLQTHVDEILAARRG
eukprot:tig00021037_g17409.t1